MNRRATIRAAMAGAAAAIAAPAVAQAAGKSATYFTAGAGKWYRNLSA